MVRGRGSAGGRLRAALTGLAGGDQRSLQGFGRSVFGGRKGGKSAQG